MGVMSLIEFWPVNLFQLLAFCFMVAALAWMFVECFGMVLQIVAPNWHARRLNENQQFERLKLQKAQMEIQMEMNKK